MVVALRIDVLLPIPHITVHLPVYKNRVAIIWSVLQPRHLAVVALFIVLGACSGFCVAEMRGYHGLWESCDE